MDGGSWQWISPMLPRSFLIDVVSRLSAKDACKMKALSKAWLSFISSDPELKRLHRLRASQRPPLLVITDVISESGSGPHLFIEEERKEEADTTTSTLPLPLPLGRNLVYNCQLYFDFLNQYVASCRDLMCFYNDRSLYVYSPSTNQYLLQDSMSCRYKYDCTRIALVYVASMRMYKVVKLELLKRNKNTSRSSLYYVRFEALTLQEFGEEKEEEKGRGGVDEHQTSSSWQLISEHDISSKLGRLKNLIGVNGVAYSIIIIKGYERVLSLGFEEENNKFKMFSLPKAAEDSFRVRWFPCRNLCQVKDLLCYPVTTSSSIDLWLLTDRYTCTWLKGYTISFAPTSNEYVRQVAYLPNPNAASSDADAGLFLFIYGDDHFQYDIRTKEATHLANNFYDRKLHLYPDNLYALKNGLQCPRMPVNKPPRKHVPLAPPPYSPPHMLQNKLPPKCIIPSALPPPPPPYLQHTSCSSELKRREPHRPLPQGSLPPPPAFCHNQQHTSCSSELKRREPHHSLPQGSLPPPPYRRHEIYAPHLQEFNRRLPPPPPPPQSSLQQPSQICLLPPPPPYYHPSLPQGSLPPPPCYHHNSLQHTANWINPIQPLPKDSPPPSFDPENFQFDTHLPEVKRRKLQIGSGRITSE